VALETTYVENYRRLQPPSVHPGLKPRISDLQPGLIRSKPYREIIVRSVSPIRWSPAWGATPRVDTGKHRKFDPRFILESSQLDAKLLHDPRLLNIVVRSMPPPLAAEIFEWSLLERELGPVAGGQKRRWSSVTDPGSRDVIDLRDPPVQEKICTSGGPTSAGAGLPASFKGREGKGRALISSPLRRRNEKHS